MRTYGLMQTVDTTVLLFVAVLLDHWRKPT
jgi:hypothetical protein